MLRSLSNGAADALSIEAFRRSSALAPLIAGNEKALHPVLAAFIGVFLALLGIFVPLWCVALGIGIAVFLFISFLSPEFCFFFSLLSLPYLSLIPNYTGILSAVAVIGALSFIRKTVFGKRVICIEQYDLVLGLFVLLILVGSFINMTADSIIVGMSMAFMALGYFLSSNVVTNRRLADCAVNAVVISALPAALVSLTAFFIDAYGGRAGAFLEEGISSTFSSPVAASAYFTVATIFSLTLAKESKGGVRGVYSAFLVLSLTGLVLTGRLFSLFALLITIAAYYSLKSGAWLALFLPILFLIPYMFLLLPEAFLSALPSAAYTDGSVATFKSALGAFLDNPVFGIGIGTDSFSQKMADYGVSGFENSGNLFLELGLGSGALLLAVFILLLVVRLIHRAYYQRYVRKSQLSKLSPLASVALMALLVLGCFDYIFSDLSILYLFFAVFGIGGASLRVCKRDYDDRTLYFEHEKSSTSSVISVYIR